ncbi:MAG: ABC transporter permease [Spirochaetota bacterium]
MKFLKQYLIPRLIQYVLVIFLGLTAVFLIPRLAPSDPVESTITSLQSMGGTVDAATLDETMETMRELYGLSGSTWQQYLDFWGRVFRADFGVSFSQFPTPVIQLIRVALPWTLGLLLFTTFTSWIAGNIVGAIVGYYNRKRWARMLDTVAMIVRPMPYYMFAFALLLIFGYLWPVLPIGGGASLGRQGTWTINYLHDVLRHAILPAMSLVLLGGAVWFQTMKLIVQNVNSESFVQYAKMGGIQEGRIIGGYVIRNALLPQITALALLLGQILSGALITEIVYSYPGVGTLLYQAIVQGDYNLIMGITSLSIVAITTSILIIDLVYPLFDPRVRLT